MSSCLSMISVSHHHHHHHSDSGGGSSVTPSRGSRSRSRSSSKERLLSKLADAAAVIDTPVGEDEIKGESLGPLVSLPVCLLSDSPLSPPHFDSDWAQPQRTHAPRESPTRPIKSAKWIGLWHRRSAQRCIFRSRPSLHICFTLPELKRL